jgi:hypothetical protein
LVNFIFLYEKIKITQIIFVYKSGEIVFDVELLELLSSSLFKL